MGLTKQLGEFLTGIRFEDLPADAVSLARDAFIDTIGVIMAGIDERGTQALYQELIQVDPAQGVRGCLSERIFSVPDAALLAGTAAHAHDFDDQALTGHPSAVLISAILAQAEETGASGRDMITAYVAGYEVWADLVGRGRNYHAKGWHPTSVFGVVGAAAAAAVLLKLDAVKAANALAIATSHASGLSVNFGTMVKPYHAGMCARDGVFAARLAARGMEGSDIAIEHGRGFLFAFTPDGVIDLQRPTQVGKHWEITTHRLCFKRYPTCYFMHRSFDATVKMLGAASFDPEHVLSVEVEMNNGQAVVLANERPQNALQAKFSEQFAMACAVILGRMGLAELTDAIATRADFQAFYPKVRIKIVDSADSRDPAHAVSERVVITMKDGRQFDTGPITAIKGHAFDPLSDADHWEKFTECCAKTHSPEAARALFESVCDIVEVPSTAALPTAYRIFG